MRNFFYIIPFLIQKSGKNYLQFFFKFLKHSFLTCFFSSHMKLHFFFDSTFAKRKRVTTKEVVYQIPFVIIGNRLVLSFSKYIERTSFRLQYRNCNVKSAFSRYFVDSQNQNRSEHYRDFL